MALLFQSLIHVVRHAMELLCSDDKIDMRQVLEQRLAARLGHAAKKPEHDFRALSSQVSKHSHFPKRFLVGHVAHAASVQEHNVSLSFMSDPLVTARNERMR